MRAASIVAVLLMAQVAAAQDRIDAGRGGSAIRVGLGPSTYPGWCPVNVPLDGGARPGEVRIQVDVIVDGRSLLPRYTARRTVALAPRARRSETLHVPIADGTPTVRVRVEARHEGERDFTLIADATRAPNVISAWSAMGRVAIHAVCVHSGPNHAQPLAWLTEGLPFGGETPNLSAECREPAELPDRVEGYDGLDLVVLKNTSGRDFDEPRRRALLAWVRGGGRILLVPGDDPAWFRDDLVKALLPADLEVAPAEERLAQASANLDDALKNAFAKSSGPRLHTLLSKERAGAVNEVEHEGRRRALATVFVRGSGRVFACGIDPENELLQRDVALRRQVGHTLLRALGLVPRAQGRPERDQRLVSALDLSELPSPLLVLPVVLAYILCMGPLTRKLQNRLRSPTLIVATTPVFAAVFTGVVFGAGYVLKGYSTVVERITVLDAVSGEDAARERTALAIHSASSRTYRVASDPAVVAEQVYLKNVQRTEEGEVVIRRHDVLQEDGRFAFPLIPVDLWDHAFFEATGARPLGGAITFDVRSGQATVTNGSTTALGLGIVYAGEEQALVGPLAPGATAKVMLARNAVEVGPDGLARLFPDEDATFVRRALVGVSLAIRGRTLFVAALDPAPPSLVVDGRARATRECGLLALRSSEEDRDEAALEFARSVRRTRRRADYDEAIQRLALVRPGTTRDDEARNARAALEADRLLAFAYADVERGDWPAALAKLKGAEQKVDDRGVARELGRQAQAWQAGIAVLDEATSALASDEGSVDQARQRLYNGANQRLESEDPVRRAIEARAELLSRVRTLDSRRAERGGSAALAKGDIWSALAHYVQATRRRVDTPEIAQVVASENKRQSLLERALKAGGAYGLEIDILHLLARFLPVGDPDRAKAQQALKERGR